MISSHLKAMYTNYILINQNYILMGKYAVKLVDHHGKQTMIPHDILRNRLPGNIQKPSIAFPHFTFLVLLRDQLSPVSLLTVCLVRPIPNTMPSVCILFL